MSSVVIVDCGSDKVPALEIVVTILGYQVVSTSLEALKSDSFDPSTPLILSGSPTLLTEMDTFPLIRSYRWLKNWEAPILGICFGHQLLGLVHGSRVQLIDEDRDAQSIFLQPAHPLFEGLDNPSIFQEDHCEAITLPDGFQLLASSDACALEAMAHPEKPHFGVQFHPEVSGVPGKTLLSNFLKMSREG